ncbi:phenylalanine--tRNA ligase subunit beta [Candidatus Nitrotoga sp. 1052]|uniref:phenylalanine--tRNA ligase subunit beta n=1 Tax=Candidatus Nitrotoga sp. 1052 TaxID=2886964 RepID=UPI001EF4D822|nr:phenylalanine--tRNA ligase subunit beta [Candidatus Nitrotoga sp. 1052]CAH1070143.1 phenylalanine--tRNA ligase subunit beta [Candidatus Nitrotoga sp. 1052]
MKFSENWLRSWINPELSSHELAHALTMAGLEVEALESVAPAFNNVVVAEVLEVIKHPNADRLNVCQVNVGEAAPLNIVCGAPNVAVGMKVPCARIGAVLPGDFVIKQAMVRNVDSFGMLCSAKELGLAEESQGLWLLPEDAPVGAGLREYLELDDMLFTLKLTPNRSDCLSMAGVAREVAAIAGGTLNALQVYPVQSSLTETLAVNIDAPEACRLYCGRIVRGMNSAAATPSWMMRRLERGGLRSINAVVDITNYVMLELGQPLHAFDLAKLAGGIAVRYARSGEELALLNGQSVTLQDDMLVVADDTRLLALAGIMGGAASSVETATRDVFLESAFFVPDAIVGKARRLTISTDSSYRFERGVDFAATRMALERATQLLLEICGGQAGAINEVHGKLPARDAILLRTSRVKRVLGIVLDAIQITALLQRLQFKFEQQGDDFHVTPPSYRFDISLEVDLIEEIARIAGYDNIPAQPPQTAALMVLQTETQRPVSRLRQLMVARDYQETISYAFLDAEVERDLCANTTPVTLKNPISSQLAVMRSSLLGGLIGALRINFARKQSRVRLFETGVCFTGESYAQRERFAGLCYGTQFPEQWGETARSVDFYDVKADIEALFAPALLSFLASPHPASHPGRSAQIFLHGQMVGWVGELHPKWLQQYGISQIVVWFEVELDALISADVPHASEISKFPPVRRDLAVVVDESVTAQSLLDAMLGSNTSYVAELALFDLYRGKGVGDGKKSLAFRVLLQDTQKTLIDSEIELSIARLVAVLQQHGAQLRI